MLILAVDTSTRTGSLAVLQDANVIKAAPIPQDSPSSSALFTQLKLILAETGHSLPEFELFVACAGPGSFTGVRVGLTAIKAWAEVYQRPIAPVGALEAIAEKGRESIPARDRNPVVHPAGLIAAFFSAGRGQVYGAAYTRGPDRLHRVGDEMVAAPGDFLNFLRAHAKHSDVTLVSTTPSALDDALGESVFNGLKVQAVSDLLADAVGILGYKQALRKELVNAYTLDANYLRRCDAELFWTDKPKKAAGS